MASSKKPDKVKSKKRIKKTDIQNQLEETKVKHKEVKEFIIRLENTLKLKKTEKSELEGAILALHTVLTGEKIK